MLHPPTSWLKCLLPAFLLSTDLRAQHWTLDFGGLGNDAVTDLQSAPDGSLYAVGEFSHVMEAGGNSYTSQGGTDLFLAKVDPAGNIIWMVTAGGPQLQKSGKLAVDAGRVAITGQFMGQTDLFGTPVNSTAGSMDLFVAVFDADNGSAQWVRTGACPEQGEKANGIALSPNGQVTVTGEFRGEFTFGGTTMTSVDDPYTLGPSLDVFIQSFSASGSPLWSRQGAAEFTDRGVDVVSDPLNNLYVCGQFSDTITFGQSHPNMMFNSTFLLKLDAAGEEQWFRHYGGGATSTPRDLHWTTTGELMVAGDMQGNMIYLGDVITSITADDPYNIYLLRVGANGVHLSDTTFGSSAPVSIRAIDQHADTLVAYGTFECQFADLAEHYESTGFFMAIGPEDFFLIRQDLSSGAIIQAQQIGGHESKRAGGVAILPDGEVVFAGSFSRKLFFPSDEEIWGEEPRQQWLQHRSATTVVSNCGDPYASAWSSDRSAGLKDGFIARGLIRDRSPYDIWGRFEEDVPCDRSALDPCIAADGNHICQDSVRGCWEVGLTAMDWDNGWTRRISSWYASGPFDYHDHVGPDLDYLWSTGQTSRVISVQNTGWYWCTISTPNGCWVWTDSVHVTVDQYILPLIWDELGVNVASNGQDISTRPLTICGPTWLWTSDLPAGYEPLWVGTDSLFNDSILVSQAGLYTLRWLPEDICVPPNIIQIFVPPVVPLPTPLDVEFEWSVPDTMVVCEGDCAIGEAIPTWYVNGVATDLDPGLSITLYGCGEETENYPGDLTPLLWSISPSQSGWYTAEVHGILHQEPCGAGQFPFSVSDSVYIVVLPRPSVWITGPETICPTESIQISVECSFCTSTEWMSPITTPTSSTATIEEAGEYGVVAFNTYGGVSCAVPRWHFVEQPPLPQIVLQPELICAGDTALLFTDHPGTSFNWYGPDGPIAQNAPMVPVTAFGDYELEIVDQNGCTLTSAPISLMQVASPYMDVQPDFILCPGDEVTIEVITNDPGSIAWQSPLSGNASLQTISTPGIYSCSVSSCTTQTLSVNILGGDPDAVIVPAGPITLCNGDSVELTGAPGQAFYLWDGTAFAPSLVTDVGGEHVLVVFDGFGCTDTAYVLIDTASVTEPLSAIGDTLCVGGVAVLSATGSGVITWYADATLNDTLALGSTLTLTNVQSTTTFYITQLDGQCGSGVLPVTLVVAQPPGPLVIEGSQHLCEGETLTLQVAGVGSASAVWSTPNGPVSTLPLSLAEVVLSDAGPYVLTAHAPPCPPVSTTHVLTVSAAVELDLGPDTALCPGTALQLVLPTGFSNAVWSTGAAGDSILLIAPLSVNVSALDSMGCSVTDAFFLNTLPCAIEVPNIFTPNGDGTNDGWLVSAPGYSGANAVIKDRWGLTHYAGDPRTDPWNGRSQASGLLVSEGVYFYVLQLSGMSAEPMQLSGYIHLVR